MLINNSFFIVNDTIQRILQMMTFNPFFLFFFFIHPFYRSILYDHFQQSIIQNRIIHFAHRLTVFIENEFERAQK